MPPMVGLGVAQVLLATRSPGVNQDKTQEMVCSLSQHMLINTGSVQILRFTLESKLLYYELIDNVCKIPSRVTICCAYFGHY